jgi:hypothetical protein
MTLKLRLQATDLDDLAQQLRAILAGWEPAPALPFATAPVATPGPAPVAEAPAEAVAEPAAVAADQAAPPEPAKTNGATPPAPKRGRGRPKKAPEAPAAAAPAEAVEEAPAAAAKAPGPKAEAISDEEEATLRARLRGEAARVQRLHGVGARSALLAEICGEDTLMIDEVPVGHLAATLAAFQGVS